VLRRTAPVLRLIGLDCVRDRIQRVPPGVYDQVIRGTTTATPLEDASVDASVVGEFIEHLSEADVDRTLQQFVRVLRAVGKLLMATPNPLALSPHRAKRARTRAPLATPAGRARCTTQATWIL